MRGRGEEADARPRRGRSAAGERGAVAAWGEELAARTLVRSGLEILDRNWRSGRRELDIVAREGDVVAFVEVKTRGPGLEAPLEAVDRRKRRDLRRAAEGWIHAHPGVGREFRFDVVAVERVPGSEPRLEHVRAAFHGDDV